MLGPLLPLLVGVGAVPRRDVARSALPEASAEIAGCLRVGRGVATCGALVDLRMGDSVAADVLALVLHAVGRSPPRGPDDTRFRAAGREAGGRRHGTSLGATDAAVGVDIHRDIHRSACRCHLVPLHAAI